MGTRNLTIVRLGGQVKVAQYCQWDGYPTGQGEVISEFIRTKLDLRKFKAKVKALDINTTDQEIEYLYEKCIESKKDFRIEHPAFHDGTGANILELVQNGVVTKVLNSMEFLKDGLFCEYAYEIDLDKKVVNIYTGDIKPRKTLTFVQFAKKGAMQKLEQELQGEG